MIKIYGRVRVTVVPNTWLHSPAVLLSKRLAINILQVLEQANCLEQANNIATSFL